MLVIGTLMYNEILVVPYCEFNIYTQKAIAARQKVNNGEEKHKAAYISFSPGAAYDFTRNKRASMHDLDYNLGMQQDSTLISTN